MGLKQFIEQQGSHKSLKSKNPSGDILGVDRELLVSEYQDGVPLAENCMIEGLDRVFSWKRGFQNCFTGFPNSGKTTFTLFIMTVKALKSGWKWVFWSPEMRSGSFVNGKVRVHYNDLINEIVTIISGKTVYKHIADKYNCPRISLEEYMDRLDWVDKHFIPLNPEKKDKEYIYELLKRTHGEQGFDGIFIDPFKNIEHDIKLRDDIYLDRLFSKFLDLSIETNTVMNWIAHPKSNVERIRTVQGQQQLIPCSQFMLAGGAAWDNNMDGIYSIHRPNLLEDANDPYVTFINMKQRKQDLTTPKGEYEYIKYDPKSKRYWFDGMDILMDPVVEMTPINNDIFKSKTDVKINTDEEDKPF